MLAVAVSALCAPVAGAATFDVTTTNDGSDLVPGDGDCEVPSAGLPLCSLRAAIEESEELDSSDVINVPAGTYLLADGLGQLSYTDLGAPGDSITIDGAGARTTIVDGGGTKRIITINSGTVTLADLTLTNGSVLGNTQGGALDNSGNTTLLGMAITNNSAGPDQSPGIGGGIYHGAGSMTVVGSTVSGNFAHAGDPLVTDAGGFGGGIYVDGPGFTMVNSTVSGNTAGESTAVADGSGGGIYIDNSGLSLTNVTVAGNTSQGSAGVGAGIFLEAGTVTGSNTAIAGNANAVGARDCAFGSEFGAVVSNGGNVGPPGCFTGGIGDLSGDPLLGPLQDNGGQTDTRALGAGSPAIDAGVGSGCPGADQRGTVRPQGAACDSGAFEATPTGDGGGGGGGGGGGLPLPVLGETFNIERVSGRVLIASGSGPQLTGARAAQKGRRFVPLTEPRQLRVGSFINVRRGRARITTAVSDQGATNSGEFFKGLFQVLQARSGRQRGLTTMRLKGSSFRPCRPARGGKRRARTSAGTTAAAAQRRRLGRRTIRKLGSNANGRFRTRGRHSTATVRGTIWTMSDRCDGTLTKVKRGKVAVRDFRRKRTITVRAGKSYLAQPRRSG